MATKEEDKIKLYGLKDKDGNDYELILLGCATNWIEVKLLEKPKFDFDIFKYHLLAARTTLYPDKTIEEVHAILDKLKDNFD